MGERKLPEHLKNEVARDRRAIEEELPELELQHARLQEAQAENSISGELRRAVHQSGRLIREIAVDAGIPSNQLLEFLEGTRTLRSDVLERILQAVSAQVKIVSVAKRQ